MPVWGFLGVGPALAILTPVQNKFIPVYIWSILAINIVLTFVTGRYYPSSNSSCGFPFHGLIFLVGRIFWISIIAKRLAGQKQMSVYHTAIAIL